LAKIINKLDKCRIILEFTIWVYDKNCANFGGVYCGSAREEWHKTSVAHLEGQFIWDYYGS
jgi:hypothetical protein